MAGADGVEKLEDAIVRSAEQVAGQIRAAKEAISTVIFGQERVIENTLVTILSGGHALLIGVPGLAGDLFGRADDRVLEFFDTVCASHVYLLNRSTTPPIASS